MAISGTGFLAILLIVLLAVLTFQAHVEGKPRDNFIQDKEDNVSRIIDFTTDNSEPKAVNNRGDIPWQVLLMGKWGTAEEHICGGSIIDQQWIMSAAHCVVEIWKDGKTGGYTEHRPTSITLYAGIIQMSKRMDDDVQNCHYRDEDVYPEDRNKLVFIHKDFNKNKYTENDIVLFKLKKPLLLDNFVWPIVLATVLEYNQIMQNSKKATASGWGRMTKNGNIPPDILRYVEFLELKDLEYCKKKFDYFTDTMICHETGEKTIYKGDSGGALIHRIGDRYIQIGIMSSFLTLFRATFTNVAKFRPWIKATQIFTEYFRSSGISYRVFTGAVVDYKDARRICSTAGMRLAEPSNDRAVKLKKDTHYHLGCESIPVWIGAQGVGTIGGINFVFKVERNIVPLGSQLLDTLSLKVWGSSNDACLSLNNEKPEYPTYDVFPCISKLYPLCEDVPDTSGCSSRRTFLTRSGIEQCVTKSCPGDGEFFTPAGSNQCFKILNEAATWEQANKDCNSTGLALAEPVESVQLRNYIVQNYDPEYYLWLGACQDEPNKMMWTSSKTEITTDDPLWYPGQPNYHEGCLLLLSTKAYLQKEPEKTFWNVLSTYEFYPLCELVLA